VTYGIHRTVKGTAGGISPEKSKVVSGQGENSGDLENNLIKVENNLIKDESVVYRASLHWIAMFWPVLIGAFFGLPGLMVTGIAVFSADMDSGLMLGMGVVELLIATLFIGIGVLRMRSAEFAITTKRMVLKYGVIQRRTAEMFLQKVESIGVSQNILERIFDYGTVKVRGHGGTLEPFGNVAHALEFRRQVQEQISGLPGMQTAAVGV
jgi:uncharacterized membrane protein YdbT with pleckstrin-like domain